jgi:outer membrane autotransporter protein
LRKIDLFDGAIVDNFTGNTDGTQWALGLAGGYDFNEGAFTFGPNLAVDYYRVDIDAFTEKATMSSGLAQTFGDQSADSLTAKLGGHLAYSLSGKWGVFSPQARFDFVREFMNDAQNVRISYANDPIVVGPGQGGTFLIFTDNPDEYYFLWAVGMSAQFMGGFAGFIDYESIAGMDRITSGEVSFGLRYQSKFR